MRRAAWKRRLSQPATRLATVAGLVVALVAAQFVLLIAGGAAADREARNAASDSIEYLADISQERVLNSIKAVNHAARDITRYVRFSDPDTDDLLATMRAELENIVAADALSVTYANGDYVELRRSKSRYGEYQSYVVEYGDQTVAKRTQSVYDASLAMVSTSSSTLTFGPTKAPAYLEALTSSTLVWTGPVFDAVADDDVVRASLSTRDPDGTVTMVVAADLALQPLQDSLSTLPTGADGAISVKASDGTVVASPWSEESPPAPATDAADPLGLDRGYATVHRDMSEHGVDWVVEIKASADGLNEGYGRLRDTLNVVMGGLMILTVALGYLLARLWGPMRAMREGAERDVLTGLYNRRHVDAAAESMLRFADRTEARAAFVMMDLDEFKSVNDDLGHGAGDSALRTVGAQVLKQIRAGDMAARWGGDEFLLVLLLAPDDDPELVVERIRAAVSDALAEVFPARPDLGVTAGYATTDMVGDDVGVLIASADRALVRGKAVAKGYTYALTPRTADR